VVVVFCGAMSHTIGDVGYVLLLPLSATLLLTVGRHPLAGLAAAFSGVSGGFAANLLISPTSRRSRRGESMRRTTSRRWPTTSFWARPCSWSRPSGRSSRSTSSSGASVRTGATSCPTGARHCLRPSGRYDRARHGRLPRHAEGHRAARQLRGRRVPHRPVRQPVHLDEPGRHPGCTMLPYSLCFFIGWTTLLVVWVTAGWPVGPGAPVFLH